MTFSTHVLDTTTGRPAAGVAVLLDERELGSTDADGRLRPTGHLGPGRHRLTFGTGDYFGARGVAAFYPEVTIAFTVTDPAEHYHVPLLLSPFGYSTYRGS